MAGNVTRGSSSIAEYSPNHSLTGAITARIGDEPIPSDPLEHQIAYRLRLAEQTDIEDAVQRYPLFEERLHPGKP